LRARKAGLMQTLLPHLQIVLPTKSPLDRYSLFSSIPKALWLEIGFGGGEHLAAQAQKNPDVGFIGAEPFLNGTASLLAHIDAGKLSNIRIFPNDARPLLDALPEASIDRCFVLFADPWPKARHAERRFIGPENVPRLSRVLKAKAELCLATDDAKLGPWMIEQMNACDDFAVDRKPSLHPPEDWVSTRYEQKAIAAGRAPIYFSYRRKAR